MLGNYKVYGIKPLLSSIFKRDNWEALEQVDVLFVVHDGHRSYRFNGRQYAPLIDSLQEIHLANGQRCVTIAEPFSQVVGDRAFGRVVDFNGSFARAAVHRIIANMFATERLRGTRYIRDVWMKILLVTRPLEVIAIQPSQSLCSACRELGIKVSDFQHGVINNAHPWYGAPFLDSSDTEGLPTEFSCWDHASARVLETWAPAKGIGVRVVGNPWTRRFVVPDPTDALVREANEDCAWIHNLPPIKRILVTLAWGSGDVPCPAGFPHYLSFPTPILNIIRRTAGRAIWFIRPHPIQMRGSEGAQFVSYLRDEVGNIPNVFCEEVAWVALPVLLAASDAHLTISSTVTSEAALFEVPTGLVAPNPRPPGWLDGYFEEECATGLAEFIPNTEAGIGDYLRSRLALAELR